MKIYRVLFSKQAQKDISELTSKQKAKLQEILLNIIAPNPYLGKALKGDLNGLRSYRLNLKDRIVYEIYEEDQSILIIRAKTHYGE
ncbi:MAG: type II toxin-antitoxin system mRNA interferase toxin, RelE/StbE family [Pseudanabaena frigida]|uniref:Type II toxin-antitoxin system mRNA interferase toxin, RelE/StbE family n=1 Tax=Pseudanabaena frigida TaxID=945775 RepID=A0A2W4WB99_9CYAN|nr:MAG: type II toxin-antitoxin system mRNA interferase toxin, RelE/StbE family [Pseudanabaena frigida]